MSGPEDFKLGHKHNAGDPEGRRVMKPPVPVAEPIASEPPGCAYHSIRVEGCSRCNAVASKSVDVQAFVHSALWPADTSEAQIAIIAIEAYLKAHNAWQARAPVASKSVEDCMRLADEYKYAPEKPWDKTHLVDSRAALQAAIVAYGDAQWNAAIHEAQQLLKNYSRHLDNGAISATTADSMFHKIGMLKR